MKILIIITLELLCINISFGQPSIEFSIKEKVTEWSYATQTRNIERKERKYKRKWNLLLTIYQSESADTLICHSNAHLTKFIVKKDLIFRFGNRTNLAQDNLPTSTLGWLPEDQFSIEHVVVKCLYPDRQFKGVKTEVNHDSNKCDKFCNKEETCTTIKSMRNKWAFWDYNFAANICSMRIGNDIKCIQMTFNYAQNNSAIWGSHGTNRKLRIKRIN